MFLFLQVYYIININKKVKKILYPSILILLIDQILVCYIIYFLENNIFYNFLFSPLICLLFFGPCGRQENRWNKTMLWCHNCLQNQISLVAEKEKGKWEYYNFFCSIWSFLRSQTENWKIRIFKNTFQVLPSMNRGKWWWEKHILSIFIFFSIQIYCINRIMQSKQTHPIEFLAADNRGIK